MARANRLRLDGGTFHVTHRCHNKEFLLKFAGDRDHYRAKVREHLRKYDIAILDYCVTSNHVHFIADASDRFEVAAFMREVAGEFAKDYNRRKNRQDAVWGDTYHATLVESGEYLWQCLCYVEMNMNRCGVVDHPREWEWLGYHEITGRRKRYRLLDLERLCWRLRAANLEEVRRNLEASLAERIARAELKREPSWTESLAIGSESFLGRVKGLIVTRQEMEIVQTAEQTWALRETPVAYGQELGPKNGCRPDF